MEININKKTENRYCPFTEITNSLRAMMIRSFIILLLVLFCQNAFCQEYSFDIFLEYEFKNNKKNLFMLNSSDDNYVFYCYSNGAEYRGRIIDHKSYAIHNYSLVNNKNNNTIEFKYLYSEKDAKYWQYKKKPCTVETEKYQVTQNEIDSLNQSFEIIEFTNKKKKRIYQNVTINMMKIESKALPSIAYGFFKDDYYAKCKIVDLPKGYIPTLIIKSINNEKWQMKLIQSKKINTILSIKPNEIKYN